ncbi:uncharacterized protein LOC111293900 [Durio zibethinus]|uniref:Uncharacterized protein LOC111293900 n=1 Tax=Durio zibethinus TaxID=66656 RepID=A0A6P5YQ95_DURZI|nr:uncharacterized protein LOC111293900 [Durio zibethinus]
MESSAFGSHSNVKLIVKTLWWFPVFISVIFSNYQAKLFQVFEGSVAIEFKQVCGSSIVGSFSMEGRRDLIRVTLQCKTFTAKCRPKMDKVALELEHIHDKEMALTTPTGEDYYSRQ